MDDGRFDDLIRAASDEGACRRAVLRLLAGGVLAGLAVRLGLGEGVDAKPKHKRQKATTRKERDGNRQLQAQGKNKRKKRKNKRLQPCGPGEHRCGPGPCIPSTVCCSDQTRCPDGSCVTADTCCAHERPCGLGLCIPADACCPDEWRCGDGSCVTSGRCCPDERSCGDGECVAENACCADEKSCPGGTCVSEDACCPGEKLCDRWCIPEESCCELDPPPLCLEGQKLACCHGTSRCVNEWEKRNPPCGIYRNWLTYNASTCRCECPAGTVGHPLTPYCCPDSHPIHSESGLGCNNGVWNDWLCPLGFHSCPEQPWECCLSSPWPTVSD